MDGKLFITLYRVITCYTYTVLLAFYENLGKLV